MPLIERTPTLQMLPTLPTCSSKNLELKEPEDLVELLKLTLQKLDTTMTESKKREQSERKSDIHSITHYNTDVFDVSPQLNIRKHQALVRVFGYETIPVIDVTTMEIDYLRLPLERIEGAPVLTLDLQAVDKKELAVKVVIGVVDFFANFELFYKRRLTVDLFDDMAWRYMSLALESADLAALYDEDIIRPRYKSRGWREVKKCLSDMFNLPILTGDVLGQLFTIAPIPGEHVLMYVDRIKALIRATQMEGLDEALVATITASLPGAGQDKVMQKFGTLKGVSCVGELLRFMRESPSIMYGEPSVPSTWLLNKFANDTIGDTTIPQHQRKGKGKAVQFPCDNGDSRNFHPYRKRRSKRQ
ncbi:hypothetical protein BGZ98_000963 [Dissophora globulifera]|nr:hypothetical protein BGZ98_000963 [Dissophora globulifera]